MNCAQHGASIQELADGTIGPIRKAELQQHLDHCEACRALAGDLQAIRDLGLSLEPMAPPDGVWLQVAGRLRQEGRVSAPPAAIAAGRHHYALVAIAATLLLAVGVSMALLLPGFRANTVSRMASGAAGTAPGRAGNAAAAVTVQSVEDEFRLAEQHYQNAIGKLEQAARLDASSSNESAIDPRTAALLQKNLQVIDQAIAESRAALRAEPQSAPARDSLFEALKRKVGLLQDTIALMNEMRKGNSAGAAQIVGGLNKS
jgi:anti-sigma factor RsiW